jgi:hypothetical protein
VSQVPPPAEATARPPARLSWEGVTCTGIAMALGAAAGAGSFAHIRDVAAGHGQDGWIAYAIAGSVDLMAVGSGLEIRRRRRLGHPARWPVFTLLLGVAMTLAANLATAAPSWWGRVMAVWPAVAFLAVVGLFETRVRRGRAATGPAQAGHLDSGTAADAPSSPATAPEPTTVPSVAANGRPAGGAGKGRGGTAAVARMRAHWAASRAAGQMPTGAELARVTGTDPSLGRRVRRQLLEDDARAARHGLVVVPGDQHPERQDPEEVGGAT